MAKRYYWLKLQNDFFDSVRIKKLRRLAGGDTYTIIYLKMQLLALKKDGVLRYTGLEQSFAEELALDINEEADDVAVTLQYLKGCGLVETSDDIEYFLPYVIENTGSETAAAQRMRDMRKRNIVTPMLQNCYGEIEKEKEIDIDIEKRGKNPTLEDISNYITEKGMTVDPKTFFDYYEVNNWKDVKNWKQKLITWNSHEKNGKQIKRNFNFQQRNDKLDSDVQDRFDSIIERMKDEGI